MTRPRAGGGWSAIKAGDRYVPIMQDDACVWVTTGVAVGWPRCVRCRRPFERRETPCADHCVICWFYHMLPVGAFWRIHDTGYPLAPYNHGRRSMRTGVPSPKNGETWRQALRRARGEAEAILKQEEAAFIANGGMPAVLAIIEAANNPEAKAG